jgi:RNA polymerase sigma-70 factor (ECF subfamily)
MEPSRDLVTSAAQGDASAVEVLLQRLLPRLRAFIRLRMGAELRLKESTSDLVQSSCREVLQNMDRYQYQGESQFRHWLFATALRKVHNRVAYYRAERRDPAREVTMKDEHGDRGLAEVYAKVSTPSRILLRKEQTERLEKAFDRLPEHYREVVTLARIVGLSHKEIAEATGRTESSTRNLLYRAMAELGVFMAAE